MVGPRTGSDRAALALLGLAGTLAAFATSGCVEDTACGVCDDENLVLQVLGGPNYTNELVRIVSPECVGERCPKPFDRATYFVESIERCEETDAALASVRGPEEYCKIAPLVVASGLQFVFNNLLDPSYVEVIRKRPENPNLFETYDWKTRILAVEGPVARYNGDWRDGGASGPDVVTRAVNLSCVDNLREAGIGFADEDYADPATNPCNQLRVVTDGSRASVVPYKLRSSPTVTATRGTWDDRAVGEAAAIDCDTPEDGPDTCCSQCDWSLGVAVSKYGEGAPIPCDPLGDRLLDCAGFVAKTARDDEPCEEQLVACNEEHAGDAEALAECQDDYVRCETVPRADRLRELHPALREATPAQRGPACRSNSECRDPTGIALVGAECIGTNAAGDRCALDAGDPACTAGECLAPWFVECRADPDTTGGQGFCVDARHDADAAGACYEGTNLPGCEGDTCRLSQCDDDGDGNLTAAECCAEGQACDPIADNAVVPRHRYDRKDTMPAVVRALDCGDWFHAASDDENDRLCDEGHTCRRRGKTDDFPKGRVLEVCDGLRCQQCRLDMDGPEISASCRACDRDDDDPNACRNEGDCDDEAANVCSAQPWVQQTCGVTEGIDDWAVNFVTRLGGVIYDPALKGIEWRPADLGGNPRALIEMCAEERGLIAPRNVADGWRAHDADGLAVEREAEWDLGMCSGQRYEVTFTRPGEGEYLRDKVGNTLEGKDTYVFETPEFHVVPESGFPNDALRIGACDSFSLAFSNKYDLSPENLDKLELVDVARRDAGGTARDARVAGGVGCARTREARDANPNAVPCLTIDVTDQPRGIVRARIDPVQFGSVLAPGRAYELVAPGFDQPPLPRDATVAQAEAYVTAVQGAYASAFWDVCGMPLVTRYLAVDHADDSKDVYETEYSYVFTVDQPRCEDDEDGDTVDLSCDNAPELYNPGQSDLDRDGVGDVSDACPASPELGTDTGDSDRDGVGNGCDVCAQSPSRYNALASAIALAPDLYVRNVPAQSDADEDGIGDVCDNCPTVANCEGYDVARPWRLGDPIDVDAGTCQQDADQNMLGDECEGMEGELAAGPIGLGDGDDLDQDGIANGIDACPRQPELVRVECSETAPCPDGRLCEDGDGDPETPAVCDHLDHDGDGVGDVCDTCPAVPNWEQLVDGGMQEDDEDADFVGRVCEPSLECADDAGPRPIAFHAVAVAGACCTTLLVPDGEDLRERATGRRLVDADGNPVRLTCANTACSVLPPEVADAPGVLVLPYGCPEALAAAGMDVAGNAPLDTDATQGDLDALWNLQCRLPPLDQDYDGFGDGCDLCPYAFDPSNEPYVDATGRLWPHDGAACSGDRAASDACAGPPGTGGDEGDDEAGESSGESGS